MKILLDECLPLDFRHSFAQHEVHTVQWAGFRGKKNGELLRAAEDAGYEVFLTVDQGIPHQKGPGARRLAILVLQAPSNQLQDLTPLVEKISNSLGLIQPGELMRIRAGSRD